MVTVRINDHVLHLDTDADGKMRPESLVNFLDFYPYDPVSEYESEMWSRNKHGFKIGTAKHFLCIRLAHREFCK